MSRPATLRYGITSRTATYWNLYVAQQACYADQGLEVAVVVTGGTDPTIQALLDDRVDLAGCSPDALFTAVADGQDLVVVGGIVNRPVSWVVARPEVGDLAAVRGCRVGVNQTRGSVSMVLRATLDRAGAPPGSYEQVVVGTTPAMVEALREGRVDAALLTAPFDHALLREGYRGLLNVADIFPHYAFTVLNARRDWARAHQDVLARFFRATATAGGVIADGAQRARSLGALEAGTGLSGPALGDAYRVYRAPGVLARRGEVDLAGLRAVLALMTREGVLDGPLDPTSLLLPCWSG